MKDYMIDGKCGACSNEEQRDCTNYFYSYFDGCCSEIDLYTGECKFEKGLILAKEAYEEVWA